MDLLDTSMSQLTVTALVQLGTTPVSNDSEMRVHDDDDGDNLRVGVDLLPCDGDLMWLIRGDARLPGGGDEPGLPEAG
jgi:hypothetical protein